MSDDFLTPEVLERLRLLKEKYASMGQDMVSYLDGLLYSDPTFYWHYIHLDILLNLQVPKTDFPDEIVFIIYHQITELYFKLTIHELEQIAHGGREVLPNGKDCGWREKLTKEFFIDRMKRVNRYFRALINSFDIMVDGMEREQFRRFRMALLPASGFQSVQYRLIELMSTDVINLVERNKRDEMRMKNPPIEEMMDHLYWKQGAIDISTGEKTLTLKHFEQKYADKLLKTAKYYASRNIWRKYLGLSPEDQADPALIEQLKQYDLNVNVYWPLVHYKSAVRYLQEDEGEVAATGGTNWKQYLPPRLQKRIFFPELWDEQEREAWGKSGLPAHLK